MAIEGASCIIRLGLPGCGKSLDQTEVDVLDHLMAGEQVYCCYWINWKGYNDPDTGEFIQNYHYFPPTKAGWQSIKDERNCVVVFDELAIPFDSRDFEAECEWRQWLMLHRHRHVNIIANTQDISFVAKSIGVLASEFQLIERIEPSWLQKFWWWLTGKPAKILLRKDWLTLQELKKIANGWIIGEDVAIDNDWIIKAYDPIKLLHRELNPYKEELEHLYCPLCLSRQTDENNDGFCPKHRKEKLITKESGLYDTDYEPEQEEEPEIEWRPYVKQMYSLLFKGAMGKKNNQIRKNLPKTIEEWKTRPVNYEARLPLTNEQSEPQF